MQSNFPGASVIDNGRTKSHLRTQTNLDTANVSVSVTNRTCRTYVQSHIYFFVPWQAGHRQAKARFPIARLLVMQKWVWSIFSSSLPPPGFIRRV